jgi:bacillithiol system protein YtxJ
MRFFKKKMKKKEPKIINWIPLVDSNQLDTIFQKSNTIPVLIFKHSTRCGISRFVLKHFEKEYDIPSEKLQLFFLDLITYRLISNEVSVRFNVEHQSPQVIVLYKEKVVYNASHQQINISEIKDVLHLDRLN